MPVTKEDIEQARQDAKNEKNQRRMEKDIFGEATTLPGKPEKKSEPTKLPGKGAKEEFGKGMTNYKKGGKVKKYADGGVIANQNPQQPTYPFQQANTSASSNPGVQQTFNVQPQASAGQPQPMQQFKKGGSVKSSASKRADGIAMRGKTRGRMV